METLQFSMVKCHNSNYHARWVGMLCCGFRASLCTGFQAQYLITIWDGWQEISSTILRNILYLVSLVHLFSPLGGEVISPCIQI